MSIRFKMAPQLEGHYSTNQWYNSHSVYVSNTIILRYMTILPFFIPVYIRSTRRCPICVILMSLNQNLEKGVSTISVSSSPRESTYWLDRKLTELWPPHAPTPLRRQPHGEQLISCAAVLRLFSAYDQKKKFSIFPIDATSFVHCALPPHPGWPSSPSPPRPEDWESWSSRTTIEA